MVDWSDDEWRVPIAALDGEIMLDGLLFGSNHLVSGRAMRFLDVMQQLTWKEENVNIGTRTFS